MSFDLSRRGMLAGAAAAMPTLAYGAQNKPLLRAEQFCSQWPGLRAR